MKLTKKDFEALSLVEKAEHTLETGDEIMARIYMYYLIKLFAVDNFFVEIWYHQTSNHIAKVKTIEEEDILHHYGNEIDISGAAGNME
ncbi:MAG: hypothetical protein K9J27_04730 [Bacteroidales bacterium]|nr:hypothetical protein [Bacteroidales bacterium]